MQRQTISLKSVNGLKTNSSQNCYCSVHWGTLTFPMTRGQAVTNHLNGDKATNIFLGNSETFYSFCAFLSHEAHYLFCCHILKTVPNGITDSNKKKKI